MMICSSSTDDDLDGLSAQPVSNRGFPEGCEDGKPGSPQVAAGSNDAREVFATAAALPGNSHVCGAGVPCQDSARVWHDNETLILALSDGHGGKDYTRSDAGSRIAVEVAIDCMREIVAGWRRDPGHFDAARRDRIIQDMARRHVPGRIILEWYRRVRLHDSMMRIVANDPPAEDRDELGWSPVVSLYGATLLVATIFDGLVLALQLGDGEIVWVDVDEVGHRVFPPAEKEHGSNATESLASAGRAPNAMAVACMEMPDLRFILLCSDGVADPYIPENARARAENRQEELHAQWGSKFLRFLNDAEGTTASARWHSWASTLTRSLVSIGQASSDDVSVAAAWFPTGPRRRSQFGATEGGRDVTKREQ